MAEGLRCVRDLPALRAIVCRAFAFTLAGSATWALMPLVARDLTGGGPETFGLLLAALGLGAVIGAAASHEVRRRFSHEHILRAASLIFGAACLIVAARPGFAISFTVLAVGGAFWVQALSGFSVAAQLFSPRHAVGRVTATSTTVVFGGRNCAQTSTALLSKPPGLLRRSSTSACIPCFCNSSSAFSSSAAVGSLN